MWFFFVVISALCAATVLKITAPVLDRGRNAHGKGVTAADKKLATVLIWGIPAAALSIYLALGRPTVPSSFALFHDVPEMLARQDALLAEEPLQTLLKKNPHDLAALLKMGSVNMLLKRYDLAVRFFKRAVLVAAAQNDMLLAVYMEDLGRAQVSANKGIVGDAAAQTFAAILKLDPADPVARYYFALAKEQKGDVQGAVDDWTAMLATGTPLAFWKWEVRAALSAARAKLGDVKAVAGDAKESGKEEAPAKTAP
jgi:cytochrome c-type biogenesis protein CcmH